MGEQAACIRTDDDDDDEGDAVVMDEDEEEHRDEGDDEDDDDDENETEDEEEVDVEDKGDWVKSATESDPIGRTVGGVEGVMGVKKGWT